MKKVISLLLLALIVSFSLVLAACKDEADTPVVPGNQNASQNETESGTPESEGDQASEEETFAPPTLPDVRFDDQTFTVLVRHNVDNDGNDIYADVDSGDTLKEAVYQRNMVIEEKYGITIKEVVASDNDINSTLYNSVMANEKTFDMANMNFHQTYTSALEGILLDISTDLEYVDLDNPWWDHETNSDFTINNKQFMAIGNGNVDAVRGTWALIFNKNILDSLGYDDQYLYDLVREGKWTLDEYRKLTKGYSRDLNNDNIMNHEDQYAVSGNGGSFFGFMMNSGVRILDKDENDELYFIDIDDRTNGILMALSDILSTKNAFNVDNMNQNTSGTGQIWCDTFREGRSLFFSESLRTIENFRDMDADFGIIPHPKWSVDEDYSTFIHWYIGQSFSVPISAPDLTKTAVMMEEMSYLGTDMILPVYYSRVLEGKYARDEASYEMITEYIMPKRMYDVGMVRDIGGLSMSLYSLFINDANIFASTYKRTARQMEIAVEEINEAFR